MLMSELKIGETYQFESTYDWFAWDGVVFKILRETTDEYTRAGYWIARVIKDPKDKGLLDSSYGRREGAKFFPINWDRTVPLRKYNLIPLTYRKALEILDDLEKQNS